MVRINYTGLAIARYHCSYSPSSSSKLFQFWIAQTILKFSLIFCAEIQFLNKDAKTDFTSLKNAEESVPHPFPKIAAWEPTYWLIWSSDNVVMCGYVTNEKRIYPLWEGLWLKKLES